MLFVAEGEDAQTGGLCVTSQIGNRDAWHVVNRFDAIELQGVNEQMEAVRE